MFTPFLCEECDSEMEVDVDDENRQVTTCPKCDVSVALLSAGYNMPGYLPEAEPRICLTFEAAKDSLLWEIDSKLDYLAEGDDDKQNREWIANLHAARADLVEAVGLWGTIVDDSPSGTSYWIEQVNMTVGEAEDAGIEIPA